MRINETKTKVSISITNDSVYEKKDEKFKRNKGICATKIRRNMAEDFRDERKVTRKN